MKQTPEKAETKRFGGKYRAQQHIVNLVCSFPTAKTLAQKHYYIQHNQLKRKSIFLNK